MLQIWTLWKREIVRFFRQPSRIAGAIGSPLMFWLLIGSGIGTSFRSGAGSSSYLQYFFPGTLLLIVLFTAIFSTISIIEDRREGFLQSVLVAPMSRAFVVLGKIAGGASLALFQAVIFLFLLPLIHVHLSISGFFESVFILFLLGFALTALGFIIAWKMHSIQGFHAVMNLFLMPLWLVSGALFPPDGAPHWMRVVIKLNPLSYGLAALRSALFGHAAAGPYFPSSGICLAIVSGFGIFLFFAASVLASFRNADALP